MSTIKLDKLLNECIVLRSLTTKITRTGRGAIVMGSPEHKALEQALAVMDAALTGGYRKSKGLSGSRRAETISGNSVSVNKMRNRQRSLSYKMIEAYLDEVA